MEAHEYASDDVLQWKERADGHWSASAYGLHYDIAPDRRGRFHTWVKIDGDWKHLGHFPTLGGAFGAAKRYSEQATKAADPPSTDGELRWARKGGVECATGRKGHFIIRNADVAGVVLYLDGHTIDSYDDDAQAKKVAAHLNALHEAPLATERVPVIYEAGAAPSAKEGLQVVERDVKAVRAGRKHGQVKTAKDVYNLLHPTLVKQSVEVFVVVPLDIHGRPLTPTGVEVARGQTDAVHVDPAQVLAPVVSMNAKGFVCCHNHPSGAGKASAADVDLTKKINEAARALDRVCVDHVVMGDGAYESIREAYGKKAGF